MSWKDERCRTCDYWVKRVSDSFLGECRAEPVRMMCFGRIDGGANVNGSYPQVLDTTVACAKHKKRTRRSKK